MLNMNAESTTMPQSVAVEICPDRTIVRLAANIEEHQTEDGTAYSYNEVVFDLPEGRSADPAQIQENFADWWLYGQEDHAAPSLEERVGVLEDAIGAIADMLA